MTRTVIYHVRLDAYLVRTTPVSPDPRRVHFDVREIVPQWGDFEDALACVDRETARRQLYRLPARDWFFCTTVPVI